MSTIINANLGDNTQNETINIYSSGSPGADVIGEIAAIEVNFHKIFETLHNESTCPQCIALAQQTDNADANDQEQPAFALDANDNSSGSVADIDGKATTDTSNANLEPLRMSSQWDVSGDAIRFTMVMWHTPTRITDQIQHPKSNTCDITRCD